MFPKKPTVVGGKNSIASQQARVVNHAIFTTRGQQGVVNSLIWRFRNKDFSLGFRQDPDLSAALDLMVGAYTNLVEAEKKLLAYNARKKGATNG